MTNREKTLEMRIAFILGEIKSWANDWDPKIHKTTKHSKNYWKAFNHYLKKNTRELEINLDKIEYVEID